MNSQGAPYVPCGFVLRCDGPGEAPQVARLEVAEEYPDEGYPEEEYPEEEILSPR